MPDKLPGTPQDRSREKSSGSGARSRNGEAHWDLVLSAAAVTIPVLLLATVLLALVFGFRVEPQSANPLTLGATHSIKNDNAYLVDFDATKITTVASWASSISSLLPAFVMTLWSYRYAKKMHQASDGPQQERLPTPFQLSLYLQMCSGGLGSLIQGSKYFISSPRRNPIRGTWAVLAMASLLSYLIWAMDTWLHVATNTVQVTQFVPVEPIQKYGRRLPTNCISGKVSNCTVDYVETRGDYLVHPAEMYLAMNNASQLNQISTLNIDGKQVSYIGPTNPANSLDFRTSTFAISSSCGLITKQCKVGADVDTLNSYNCSSGFNSNTTGLNQGALGNARPFSVGYYKDPQWTVPMNIDAPANPSYTVFNFGLDQTYSTSPPTLGDEAAGVEPYGGVEFFAACNTTLYNLVYSSVNGTLVDTSLEEVVNPVAIAAMVEANQLGFCDSYIDTGMLTSLYQPTQQAFMQMFAIFYNIAFLAPTTTVLETTIDSREVETATLLLTRVPKASLFSLVASLALFTLFGLTIFFLALSSQPLRNKPYQLRLSIPGLTASRFETQGEAVSTVPAKEVDELFAERRENIGGGKVSRIGIGENSTGHLDFVPWNVHTPPERTSLLKSHAEPAHHHLKPSSRPGADASATQVSIAERPSHERNGA